ncbi:MAG: type IV secretory system conjugative DNA transfer family protein [Bacilli bacterium]|nr:type IV secretory system conjugative DNA transfer family protein [Bacilli bacterium]
MKLKFKAEPEDVKWFVLFSILLLYLVAIGILNLVSLKQNATFYGFNPIMAFTPRYLLATVVFFILAEVAIILAVANPFFDREKGVGFGLGKSSKGGYSRWAKPKEMQAKLKKVIPSNPTCEYAGMPMIVSNKEVWVDDGEAHSLIVGTTGTGKSRRLVTPLIKILAKKGESMILTDPKGELYEENASILKEHGYNIILLNLRSPEKGNAWNPLMIPYQLYKEGSDKSNELLNDLARNLLYDEKNKDDPFWETTSADYFTGLALGLFDDAKEEEINLNSISLMTSVGEEKYGNSNYVKAYFDLKDPASPAYINAVSTINAPTDTKGSILSVFRQKIKIFAITEHLSEMLSYSDFDMRDIGKKKTAVFIIIQDEKKTYHALATVFVKQCYETLIDVAQDNNGKLPVRTNFILDEFANMPPLKDATTMITAARSRQIRFNLIIQNFAQLNKVYGKEEAETLKGNCANLIYLLSKELQALEEISKLCGERKEVGKDGKEVGKPLITISELQRLKMGDCIIIKDRSFPFKTKLLDMSEYNFAESKKEAATYPERVKKAIQMFDIRAFVTNKKKDDVFDMLNNNNNFNNSFNNNRPPMGASHNIFNETPNSFNVDDLIKKIDAKILELEKEEAAGTAPVPVTPALETTPVQTEIKPEPKQVIVEEEPKEVVNIHPDIDKIINSYPSDENTDDQFFDDFFNDEE